MILRIKNLQYNFTLIKKALLFLENILNKLKVVWNTGKVAKYINVQRKIIKKLLFAKEYFLKKVKFQLISYLK